VPSAGVASLHKPPLTDVFAAASANDRIGQVADAGLTEDDPQIRCDGWIVPVRSRLATVVSGDRV